MILHSIVPIETIQQMFADQAPQAMHTTRTLSLSPTRMVEGVVNGGQFTISRILSTDPQDYLGLAVGQSISLLNIGKKNSYPYFL